jgi:hypothetical protein
MTNIHEILKSYGVEIPEDKKADFDKSVAENYKTVAEVDKINDKLTKATNDLKETKETLESTTTAFEELKNNNASKEDWEKKYNDLVEENRVKAEEKAKIDLEAQERAEFDKYFSDNKKEWNNPFIADGYFGKYKEAKALDENKGKMTADILHELTKDDATAFKTSQPIVTLKGANGVVGGGNEGKDLPTIF